MLSHFSCVSVILWIVAPQATLSMGFSRQEYWNRLPCPPPEDLLDPGIEPISFLSAAVASGFFTTSATWEAPNQTDLDSDPTQLYPLNHNINFLNLFYIHL